MPFWCILDKLDVAFAQGRQPTNLTFLFKDRNYQQCVEVECGWQDTNGETEAIVKVKPCLKLTTSKWYAYILWFQLDESQNPK